MSTKYTTNKFKGFRLRKICQQLDSIVNFVYDFSLLYRQHLNELTDSEYSSDIVVVEVYVEYRVRVPSQCW